MDWDSLFLLPPKHKVDTIRTPELHMYNHQDPMDTIGTKGVHVDGHLEVATTTTS